MPPMVPDSDDDGEDSFDNEEAAVQPDPAATTASANDQSTGCTERLQQQIRSAERALVAPSAEALRPMAPPSSSNSPSLSGRKRRHTAAFDKAPSLSPEKARIKRTKTQKTYSKQQRSSAPNTRDESAFANLRDDIDAVATSHSAPFSEHSGHAQSSNGLPAGSIRADFANHEPHLMFRDTGSTAVDNESSQQRMVEEALRSMKGVSTSVSRLAESDEAKSSSFPWSASQKTPAGERPRGTEAQPSAPNAQAGAEKTRGKTDELAATATAPVAEAAEEATIADESVVQQSSAVVNAELAEGPNLPVAPKSSPRVEITITKNANVQQHETVDDTKQKPSKGRRRKTQTVDSEPLNSEDRAVGLPKERYKPRPSRRRATQVTESIDFSVVPERAAKAKRTKTTSAVTLSKHEQASVASASQAGSEASVTKADKPPHHAPASIEKAEAENATQEPDSKHVKQVSDEEAAAVQPPKDFKLDTQSPDKKIEEDQIFIKPAPKPKSTSKIKRSHTTIFEDHVEFAGSQRSPSLSQQQAKRKSALVDVQNDNLQATQKKRRKVIEDDDDENVAVEKPEKELDMMSEPEQEQPRTAPKKRGKGRPAKSTTAPQPKSAERVPDDSDSEAEEDGLEESEPPKKRGRGRPAKSAKPAQSETVVETTGEHSTGMDTNVSAEKTTVEKDQPGPEKQTSTPSAPPKPAAAGTQAPTPSPEKPTLKVTSTPPSKPGPTSHSPIKSSLKAPLRVGLSRRHRIPSLLRAMKPPKC